MGASADRRCKGLNHRMTGKNALVSCPAEVSQLLGNGSAQVLQPHGSRDALQPPSKFPLEGLRGLDRPCMLLIPVR
jgi:hypothetical protein